MPVPIVDEILACSQSWVEALTYVWQFMQTDPDKFIGTLEDLISDNATNAGRDRTLLSSVRDLHPASMRDHQGLDGYTLEILKGVCRIASGRPLALQELLSGDAIDTELAWFMWKLQMNGQSRIIQPDSSPIMQLPVELLQLVFKSLRAASPRYPEDTPGEDFWDISSHLPPRLVCSHWAATISCTPALWAPIVLIFGEKMTKFALPLSQPEPLDVVASFRPRTRFGPSVSKVLTHLAHIRRLCLRTMDVLLESWSEMERLLQLLAGSPAPYLATLRIRKFINEDGFRKMVIPATLISSAFMPHLRTLSLAQCAVALSRVALQPALRHLELELCDAWSSLDDMIATLSTLPELELFTWSMSLNALESSGSDFTLPMNDFVRCTKAKINLLYMAKLTLECPTVCVVAIMTYIAIPPSCQVHILDDYTARGGRQDHDFLDGLLFSLRESLGAHLLSSHPYGSDRGFRRVVVDAYPEAEPGRGALLIEAYNFNNSPECSFGLVLANSVPGSLSTYTIQSVVCEMLQWPAMSNATSIFSTDHEALADPALWTIVLQSLPRLRRVNIDGGPASDASSPVLGLSQALNQNSVSRALAPLLSLLHLSFLDFPPSVQQHLALTCRKRYVEGHLPVALILQCCDQIDMNLLEQILRSGGAGTLYLEDVRDSRYIQYN